MRLSVELTGAQEAQLAAIARRLNVPAEVLAAAALRDMLERREADFEAAAERVLAKNAELYRRLA
ncbi:MAG: DNA-binding protein [Gemmatimonadaceae bacterium]